MRMGVMAVVVMLVGCAQSKSALFPSGVLTVKPRADSACLEQLLVRSRHAGYLEKTVDVNRGSFRVASHVPDAWSVKNGAIVAVHRGHMSKSTETIATMPGDVKGQLAVVRFIEVQCTSNGATVTPLNAQGNTLPRDAILDATQAWELQRFAGQLGAITSTLAPYAN